MPPVANGSNERSSKGPYKPPVVQPGTGNNIVINSRQRLNPMLECIRNVGKEFGDILPDFQVGRTTGVLYLSLKYHRLHPEYIHQRIELLGHAYSLRILLIMCDVSEHQEPLRELTKMCLINNITVFVAWSHDEAGLYLSTFKQFEHKPPDLIKERVDKDYNSLLRAALTSISKVNKTDVETLRSSIGSFANISQATSDQLLELPGFGQVKVKRMKEAFERQFRNNATSSVPPASQPTRLSAPDEERQRALQSLKGKGKEPNDSSASQSTRVPNPGLLGEVEENTDIVDLSSSPVRTPNVHNPGVSGPGESSRRPRPPSPVWDIELDLNASDEE